MNDAISRFLAENVLLGLNPLADKHECIKALRGLPTLDVAPVVHAGWKDQDYTFTRFQCTACKSMNHSIMTKYCPNCGALMDGEDNAAD